MNVQEPVNVIYQTAEDGLADDMEFYKGKIKNMSDRTELLQEKADDLTQQCLIMRLNSW